MTINETLTREPEHANTTVSPDLSPDVVADSVAAYTDHIDDYTAYNADKMADVVDRFAAQLHPGATILDAGCGPGRDLARFRTVHRLNAIGGDPNPEFVAAAAVHGPAQVMDLRDLPFAADSLDGIWACASLVHLPPADLAAALAEFARTARPGAPV